MSSRKPGAHLTEPSPQPTPVQRARRWASRGLLILKRLRPTKDVKCKTLVILRNFRYESQEARRGAGGHSVSRQTYYVTFFDIKDNRTSNTYRLCEGWIGNPYAFTTLNDLLDILYPEL